MPKSPLASLVETVNRADFATTSVPTTVTMEKPAEFTLPKEIGGADKEKTPEKSQIIKPTAQFSFGFNAQSDNGANNGNALGQASVSVTETTPTPSVVSTNSSASNNTGDKPPKEFSFSTAAMSLEKTPEGADSTVSPSTGFGLSFGMPSITSPAVITSNSTSAVTQPGSIFSSVTPLNNTSKPQTVTSSLFGNSGTGLFGNSGPATTTASQAATTTTSVTSPTPTAEGLFSSFNICSPSSPSNNTTAAPQNTSNLFGASTGFGLSPQSTTSIFGNTSSNAETKPSIFGTPTQPSSTAGQSPFGGASMPKPDQSVFGNNANSSVFGGGGTSNTAAASTSPFGQPQNTASIFGGATTATASPFTGGASSSIFGAKAPETQTSPFGQPQQTSAFSQGGSLFGGSSTFGSGGGATTGTTGFGFGQQQTQQPVFGKFYASFLGIA